MVTAKELAERCEVAYAESGMAAVIDLVNELAPDTPYARCSGCEADTSHLDGVCLVCGLIN